MLPDGKAPAAAAAAAAADVAVAAASLTQSLSKRRRIWIVIRGNTLRTDLKNSKSVRGVIFLNDKKQKTCSEGTRMMLFRPGGSRWKV